MTAPLYCRLCTWHPRLPVGGCHTGAAGTASRRLAVNNTFYNTCYKHSIILKTATKRLVLKQIRTFNLMYEMNDFFFSVICVNRSYSGRYKRNTSSFNMFVNNGTGVFYFVFLCSCWNLLVYTNVSTSNACFGQFQLLQTMVAIVYNVIKNEPTAALPAARGPWTPSTPSAVHRRPAYKRQEGTGAVSGWWHMRTSSRPHAVVDGQRRLITRENETL